MDYFIDWLPTEQRKRLESEGKANPYQRQIQVGTKDRFRSLGPGKPIYRDNPYYVSPEEIQKRVEKSQAENQALFRQQLADQATATQADIAKQLQIVQQEKSAVAKMQEEYTASLKAEADAKRQAQEEAELALRTSEANRMRAGQVPNLQIQPASQTPRTGGTQPFKRRRLMIDSASPLSSSLNIGLSNALNI